MKFYEYIQKRLGELYIDKAFGVPGSYIMPLWESFDNKTELILARHESGAAYMAYGWAKITGKVGVVLTTIGPGITNVMTGVACAYRDSVPLLLITGQAKISDIGTGVFQESSKVTRNFSATELLNPIVKDSFEITDIKKAVRMFEYALILAQNHVPGPVHISLPLDIQNGEIDEYKYSKIVALNNKNYFLKENMFDDVVTRKKVVILVGGGAVNLKCEENLYKLASILDAPIISTIKGISAINQKSDYYLGYLGAGTSEKVVEFLNSYSAECYIILGASLSSSYQKKVQILLDNAYSVQVDLCVENTNIYYQVNRVITADVDSYICGLIKYCEKYNIYNDNNIIKEVENTKKEIKRIFLNAISENDIMAQTVVALNECLPEDSIVVPDAGNHWLNTLSLYESKSSFGIVTNAGLGAMGHAIGAAIGYAIAVNNRKVVCVTGDGSVLMSGNEISVAVNLGLDILFIIFNNDSLGRVRIGQCENWKNKVIASEIYNFDIATWGKGLGAKSYSCKCVEEFKILLSKCLMDKGPQIIEVNTSKTEIPISLKIIRRIY